MEKIDSLIVLIQTHTKEQARYFLIEHINAMKKRIIEDAWKYTNKVLRFPKYNRKKQMREFLLETNEYDNTILELDFLKFYASLEDFIRDNHARHTSPSAFAEEIIDHMEIKSMKVKKDRRSLFQKED